MYSVTVNVTFKGPTTPAIRQAVSRGLVAAANIHRNESVRRVQQGPKSGRMYGRHQASAPGEAPATDHGRLVNSIRVEHTPGSFTASVVCGALYGRTLELGTRNIKPRPFLRVPLMTKRAEITQAVARPMAQLFGGKS